MAGIMVYLPKMVGQDPEELVRRGLGDLLDRSVSPIIQPILQGGPDGGGGKLVTFDSPHLPSTPRLIDRDAQEWLECGEYWLGYVKAQRPTPAELQRSDLFDGEPVLLADGNQWIIPIGSLLPQRLTIDRRTGEEVLVPSSKHQEFMGRCNELYQLFLTTEFIDALKRDAIARIPDGLRFCAAALSKNYRVNLHAIELLQLIESREAFAVARAATGFSAILAALAEKKNSAE